MMGVLAQLSARARSAVEENRTLLTNAGSMVATAVVTSLLGAAFWLVAARHFNQASVGVASAAISAMTLLGFLATVGLGTLLMGELPRLDRGHRSVINAALLSTASIGAALGLAFVVIAPLASSSFDSLSSSWVSALVFAIGVGLTALAFVLDQALIGLLRGGLQLSRNMVFTLVKLVALIPVAAAVANAGPQWIYGTWTAGIAVSLVVLVRFYRNRGDDPLNPAFGLLGKMRLSAATHHAVNVALRTPELVLPIVVVTLRQRQLLHRLHDHQLHVLRSPLAQHRALRGRLRRIEATRRPLQAHGLRLAGLWRHSQLGAADPRPPPVGDLRREVRERSHQRASRSRP
jgi:hypothetical protein